LRYQRAIVANIAPLSGGRGIAESIARGLLAALIIGGHCCALNDPAALLIAGGRYSSPAPMRSRLLIKNRM